MQMFARRRRASQPPPLEDLEVRIERAHRALLAARGWDARATRWDEMFYLLRQRPREVITRLERERLARVGALPDDQIEGEEDSQKKNPRIGDFTKEWR